MANVKLLFGPMLLGVFINMVLYGILIVQTYHYYLTFKKDAPWIRYLVLYLFIVESVNTGCDVAIMYQPLIENFGLPDATKNFPTLFAAEPITIVAISTPIQIFFAWRIKLLTKSNIIPLIVVALSIVSLCGGAWTTALIVKIKLFARKPELHWPALVWFLSACIADVLITVVLVTTLSKRKTGFVATDDAISKIIRMTVQTGMLTAFFAIGDVVFFMTLPHTALNFIWDLALTKLYSNCLLSTLNARASLQELTGHGLSARNAVSSDRNRRMENTIEGPAHILGSSMYELNTHKSFENSDMEYGVTITKIVETRQDPAPGLARGLSTQ
ncbi:hypothetical protein M413DRAFT_448037 [Hebeloma cylindrosporum]|uniref:DUF6534 domain-containing protein n=1 Tax=Hebeloma cylindrosporum TaxID=76867 RepID=A0A0C2YAE3_HEBCY|nr:hypothetical protein M413DRAFT_448037 [Hebeloma cylindrosporum h7]